MMKSACWCRYGACHTCQQKRERLFKCAGCSHFHCMCCAHRLGNGWACVACATTWLNVMCSLAMPQHVSTWLNSLTFGEVVYWQAIKERSYAKTPESAASMAFRCS